MSGLTELETVLLEALKEALMPVEMYRAYGWSDRARVIPKLKAAIARAEAKAKEPQCKCSLRKEADDAPVCAEGFVQYPEVNSEYCGNLVKVNGEWILCGHDRACHSSAVEG